MSTPDINGLKCLLFSPTIKIKHDKENYYKYDLNQLNFSQKKQTFKLNQLVIISFRPPIEVWLKYW